MTTKMIKVIRIELDGNFLQHITLSEIRITSKWLKQGHTVTMELTEITENQYKSEFGK